MFYYYYVYGDVAKHPSKAGDGCRTVDPAIQQIGSLLNNQRPKFVCSEIQSEPSILRWTVESAALQEYCSAASSVLEGMQ